MTSNDAVDALEDVLNFLDTIDKNYRRVNTVRRAMHLSLITKLSSSNECPIIISTIYRARMTSGRMKTS